jgi:putative transposase
MSHIHPFRPIRNQRLQENLYSSCGQSVFITICSFQNLFPFRNQNICKMVVDTLLGEVVQSKCRVIVYCLMPDHLHFVICPREDGISVISCVMQFKGKTTNQSWKLGWNGKLWQPRFYDHIVRSNESQTSISKYILENPIRKGFVSSIDDWPWLGIPE